MPTTKMRFSCGHKGHGSICNRCAEANRIEAIVNGEAKPASGPQRKNHNGKPGFDGWSKTQLLAEAIRLRGVQKSRFYSPDVD